MSVLYGLVACPVYRARCLDSRCLDFGEEGGRSRASADVSRLSPRALVRVAEMVLEEYEAVVVRLWGESDFCQAATECLVLIEEREVVLEEEETLELSQIPWRFPAGNVTSTSISSFPHQHQHTDQILLA